MVLATDLTDLRKVQRGEVVLDTGLTYDGIRPVTVRVTKREGRWNFTDDGGAVAAAGTDGKGLTLPGSIELGDYSVNVSRAGEVSLPGFPRSSDEWLNKLPEVVAEGSLALYSALLDGGVAVICARRPRSSGAAPGRVVACSLRSDGSERREPRPGANTGDPR